MQLYLLQAVPLVVTVVVVGVPVVAMIVFSVRTVRKFGAYTQDHNVQQVKSALLLTQRHSWHSDMSANTITSSTHT